MNIFFKHLSISLYFLMVNCLQKNFRVQGKHFKCYRSVYLLYIPFYKTFSYALTLGKQFQAQVNCEAQNFCFRCFHMSALSHIKTQGIGSRTPHPPPWLPKYLDAQVPLQNGIVFTCRSHAYIHPLLPLLAQPWIP